MNRLLVKFDFYGQCASIDNSSQTAQYHSQPNSKLLHCTLYTIHKQHNDHSHQYALRRDHSLGPAQRFNRRTYPALSTHENCELNLWWIFPSAGSQPPTWRQPNRTTQELQITRFRMKRVKEVATGSSDQQPNPLLSLDRRFDWNSQDPTHPICSQRRLIAQPTS